MAGFSGRNHKVGCIQYGEMAGCSKYIAETRHMDEITQPAPVHAAGANRWCQLVVGMLCMALVANLQYAWTLFVTPMSTRHHWSDASIQLAFSIFILTETWLVPIEGWLVDKFGPRPVVAGGAICAGLAWVMNSYATTLPEL